MNTAKKTAVYAGTFDPPTLGHLWMINEAARLFDEVVVAIGVNPDKKTLFSMEERAAMLAETVGTLPNVRIASFGNQYLVRYAALIGARFIVRGIRNAADYEYERAMRHINSDLGRGTESITTVFLMPPREMAEVASSTIKGLIGPRGWERAVAGSVPKAVLKKLIASKHSLWAHLKAAGTTGDGSALWETLLSAYMDDGRFYHDWRHITGMIAELEDVRHLLGDPLAVEAAVWYHDAVYDMHRDDKEEQSGALAASEMKRVGMPERFANRVAELIVLATKHGASADDRTPLASDSDARFLADLDLAVLGKPEEEFDEYEADVRKEYGWVPQERFAAGRVKILRSLVDRPSIYATPFFRERYEAQARKNLARSIARLETA